MTQITRVRNASGTHIYIGGKTIDQIEPSERRDVRDKLINVITKDIATVGIEDLLNLAYSTSTGTQKNQRGGYESFERWEI